MTILVLLSALFLDRIFAEPKRFQPLVGFGAIANKIERVLNKSNASSIVQLMAGMASWVLIVIIPTIFIVALASFVSQWIAAVWLFDIVFLYLAIGHTSLRQHTMAILQPLQRDDLALARQKLAWIVSRDTDNLDEAGVRKSTIESVLENGSDAIFAPIFWFVVGGLPAIIIYRLANTLDAMWGYKTSRFLYFGRFSARMDDILNYLPSRLVALSYAVLGHFTSAIRCWYQQAHLLASPSGGVVMSAGAGALNVTLGGDTYYHGKKRVKPIFGCGLPPTDKDITRSLTLIDQTVYLWCAVILLAAVSRYIYS
jgi:adenosylcobinamide-phosphate synthase